MSDGPNDDLEQQLRALSRQRGEPRGTPFWDALLVDVRRAYRQRRRVRHWRALVPVSVALAAAAALVLWLRAPHPRPVRVEDPMLLEDDAFFEESETEDLLDELDATQLRRLTEALRKGA